MYNIEPKLAKQKWGAQVSSDFCLTSKAITFAKLTKTKTKPTLYWTFLHVYSCDLNMQS
jgi:hypothetical protein